MLNEKGGGMMQRNLDKDDIRDASDLLTHIDGWEKTGSYDEKAIEASIVGMQNGSVFIVKQRPCTRKSMLPTKPM